MLAPTLLALCLSAAPQRYLLSVQGAPVALLRVHVDGRTYHYESTHFLEEGPKVRQRDLPLDDLGHVDGLEPEVLALARLPAPGCREVLEEVRRAPERLCITRVRGRSVDGTLAGQRFTATYDADGALEALTLGAARWEASAKPAPAAAPEDNPFARGFPVQGQAGPAALVPALDGAVRLASPPTGGATEATVGRQRCLLAARAWLGAHPRAVLVLGLVVENGRGYPHAWVREGPQHVDPSVLPGDSALAARQYVALPQGVAGSVYLELLDGARRVRLGDAHE